MAEEGSYLFQYCQKLVILNEDLNAVLLACRKNESDYNGIYSFIGGKMEVSDESFIAGMSREKNEEIGNKAVIDVIPDLSRNVLYIKKDGSAMVLPHIAGIYRDGVIKIDNEEYQDFTWVSFNDLKEFEPKIETVYEMTMWAHGLLSQTSTAQFVRL